MAFNSASNESGCFRFAKELCAVVAALAFAGPASSQVPLPEGSEKATVENICTACHTTERIVTSQRTPEDWRRVVRQMIDENGADVPQDKVEPIIAYLAKSFPPPAGASGPAPRTPDGKLDLSGTWTRGGGDRHMDIEMTAWGNAQYLWNTEPIIHQGYYEPIERQRIELDPIFHCYPPGPVRLGPPGDTVVAMGGGTAVEILQSPDMLIMIFQNRNAIRYIHLDRKEHPKPLELSWNGHSIGRWEGDTLVIDTVGVRDETWLSSDGHEHSTQLHIIERFRRPNAGTLEIERTFSDPVAMAKPHEAKVTLNWSPKYDLNQNRYVNDCSQYMVRKPGFGKGMGGLLGIGEHP